MNNDNHSNDDNELAEAEADMIDQGLGMMGGSDGPGMRDAMQMMRDPSGIQDMLVQQSPETGDSPAEIFADVINVMRADTVMLARQHGVELEARRMTPERAAELLSETVTGDGVGLVEMFNAEAAKRDAILREILDDTEYDRFLSQKEASMYTTPPENPAGGG